MRNIADYEKDYLFPNFEDYQQKYRKKKILEILQKYSHRSMVEIGVGDDPMFQYTDFQKYIFFEPGEKFFCHADELLRSLKLEEKVQGYREPFHSIENGGGRFHPVCGLAA